MVEQFGLKGGKQESAQPARRRSVPFQHFKPLLRVFARHAEALFAVEIRETPCRQSLRDRLGVLRCLPLRMAYSEVKTPEGPL